MKRTQSRTSLWAVIATALLLIMTCASWAQIPFPETPPAVPIWRNIPQFNGYYSPTNWSLYGVNMTGLGATNAVWMQTSPGVTNPCMYFTPANAYWAGATALVTNHFDDNGTPLPNTATIFPWGGNSWNILVTTTNDVEICNYDVGDGHIIFQPVGGGLYWRYSTNFVRLGVQIPATTNPVVKVTVRIPWMGQDWFGSIGYVPRNFGIIGGVTWDPIYPETPPGSFIEPPTATLAMAKWTNGVVVAYWSGSNAPAMLKRSFSPLGPYASFDHTLQTNVFGTNVTGAFVYTTNESAFYRLEN